MELFERLMKLDRRWVFLLLIIVCVWAYASSFSVPILVMPEVQSIYDKVEGLPEGSVVLVAIDYDPNNLAELHPMTYALVEQCWRKKVKTIFTALSMNGPGMCVQAIRDITDSVSRDKEYNGVMYKGREVVNGVDYCFLGYKPYYAIVILGMGQAFNQPYPTDYYGTPLDEVPMMRGIINYDQVDLVVDISGGNITDAWISYGQGRFGFDLALGLTGVMTAQYYPYLGSGQIIGIMGGLLGAAQYEKLTDNPGRAKDGMRVQLPAHLVIIMFIVMGNVGFFANKWRLRREGRV